MKKILYIIVGATASGKTEKALELAQMLNTEIVSADSRQIFKEMNIGVARPSEKELNTVPHHLIAKWSVTENYNVSRYEKEAVSVIDNLFRKYDNLILCGGSGMYINAVINGIDDMPDTTEEVRNELNNELKAKGLDVLLEELKTKDGEYYSIVDKKNPRRVLRALEVIRMTGKPFSYFRKNEKVTRNFETKIIGIRRDKEELRERINKRVDMMIKEGLVEEARQLIEYKHLNALASVGYRELFDCFDSKITLNQAIDLIKIHTSQYAKRQITWFNKMQGVNWLNPDKDKFDISLL